MCRVEAVRLVHLLVIFFFFHQNFSYVTLSSESIECCEPWESIITVTDSSGKPVPNVKIDVIVKTEKEVVSKAIYITDTRGKAKIYYKPKSGEALEIKISEPWLSYSLIIPVKTKQVLPVEEILSIVGILFSVALALLIINLIIRGGYIGIIFKTISKVQEVSRSSKAKAQKSNVKQAPNRMWMYARQPGGKTNRGMIPKRK